MSTEYHKIQSVFKRDPATNHRTFLPAYSLPEFEYLKDNSWVWTEKLDGTNIRIHVTQGGYKIDGKTDNAQIPAFLYHELEELIKNRLDSLGSAFPEGVTLYGEGVGPKIQKGGGNYCPTPMFVLFDARVGDWWLKREDVEAIGTKYTIPFAPVIGRGTLLDMEVMVRDGIKSAWGDFPAEGIVARPVVELKTRSGERIITKLKAKDFS